MGQAVADLWLTVSRQSELLSITDHAIPWQSYERANHRCAGFEDDPAIRVPRRIAEGGRGLVQPF